MKQEMIRHIGAWPMNSIHRLLLWFPPNHKHMHPAVSGSVIDSGENSAGTLLAGELSDGHRASVQVPKGFLAVYVGPGLRRFVIPMRCLSKPDFKVLMDRMAEEYGFEQEGALRIPCDEEDFEHILVRCLESRKKQNDKKIIKQLTGAMPRRCPEEEVQEMLQQMIQTWKVRSLDKTMHPHYSRHNGLAMHPPNDDILKL